MRSGKVWANKGMKVRMIEMAIPVKRGLVGEEAIRV